MTHKHLQNSSCNMFNSLTCNTRRPITLLIKNVNNSLFGDQYKLLTKFSPIFMIPIPHGDDDVTCDKLAKVHNKCIDGQF
jgi:hypothetical protein